MPRAGVKCLNASTFQTNFNFSTRRRTGYNSENAPSTAEMGTKLAHEINAVKYLEISTDTMRGVRNVF